MQEQAIAAAEKGKVLAQKMTELLRDISVTVNHVTATGLSVALETIQAEFTEFAAWDQTGDIPQVDGNDVAVPNPKYQGELVDEFSIKMTEAVPASEGVEEVPSVPEIIDGELQYTSIKVRNPKYNANIKPYLFSSSTGLKLDGNGELQGNSISDLLTMLEVAAAFDTLVKANNGELLIKIESVTTV